MLNLKFVFFGGGMSGEGCEIIISFTTHHPLSAVRVLLLLLRYACITHIPSHDWLSLLFIVPFLLDNHAAVPIFSPTLIGPSKCP